MDLEQLRNSGCAIGCHQSYSQSDVDMCFSERRRRSAHVLVLMCGCAGVAAAR